MSIFKKQFLIAISIVFFGTVQCGYSEDLDFIYGQIQKNHPGIYNQEDPEFSDHLEKNYLQAKESLMKAVTFEDSKKALNIFTKNFDDAHLRIQWAQKNTYSLAPILTSQFLIEHKDVETVWVALPTFELDQEQEKEFEKFLTEISTIKSKKNIIFDLRGNRGGNSDYASMIMDKLFGYKYAQQQRAKAYQAVSIDWRASEENSIHLYALYARYQHAELKEIVDGIADALSEQKPYYTEIPVKKMSLHDGCELKNSVAAKIVTIIDERNVSAALDCIDELKMMDPSVTLVGKTTKADRLYMECKAAELPSGIGFFITPIKVFRNRIRKDNESYSPDVEVDTKDTVALEACIADLLRT